MPVAVTGTGMICPLGISTSAVWKNMLQCKSGIGRITKFDASECATQIEGQLPEEYFELEKKKLPKDCSNRPYGHLESYDYALSKPSATAQ